jgi:hypothetical protein
MKKMTWDEWKEQELAKRKEYKEMGVIDFETIRAKKMWADPNGQRRRHPCREV